jgi:glycosyltransferase involved in cell wall biosynthesis
MRVAFVTPAFFPAVRYGGPIRSLLGLVRGLVRRGVAVRVLTTDADGPTVLPVDTTREFEIEPGLRVRYARRLAGEATSLEFIRLLPEYVRWSDVVHLTAVYNFSTMPVLAIARWARKPLVWSPRGGLQRWERTDRRCLKHAWELACRALAPENTIIHVTADDEAAQTVRRMPHLHLEVVPNGVEVPQMVRRPQHEEGLHVLFLGRIHPIKGIENLIDALSLLDESCPAHLTIAGAGDAEYQHLLEQRVRARNLEDRVAFVGAVDEQSKAGLFARTDVLVLPSHTENFGMVVVEALARAVPVIAAKGTPWAAVEREGCGLWADNSPQRLAEAISLIHMADREAMGQRGRAWMQREFDWNAIAARMLEVYKLATVRAGQGRCS